MFSSCCLRSNKKIPKSKSRTDNMEELMENAGKTADNTLHEDKLGNHSKSNINNENLVTQTLEKNKENNAHEAKSENHVPCRVETELKLESLGKKAETTIDSWNQKTLEKSLKEEITTQIPSGKDALKKRYSVDIKRTKLDFKRFSVDCRRDSATLEELIRLEQELATSNFDVRLPVRRKSTGILKSTSSYNENVDQKSESIPENGSGDDDVFACDSDVANVEESDAPQEPPATPVGRDEVALRRHRFYSDLVCAARAAVEHRVRFDPLGPVIADAGAEVDPSAAVVNPIEEFELLIQRLERVTSRLERLPALRALSPTSPRSPLPSLVTTTPSPELEETIDTDNMSVNGYQDLVQGPLQAYLQLSKQIGGDVATQANLVNAAFQAQLRYIQLATTRSKPSQGEEVQLLSPTSEQITAIQQFREKNRSSPFFNHLSAISESIPALGWVAVSPAPAPYVKEMNDAGQFYSNRVLKEWKEKDKKHADWCRAWVQLLSDLQAYVKQYHTTGLVWSGKGSGAGVPPPPPPCGMPPPPPSLPEVDFDNLSIDDRSALFAEINKGEGITSSLRKVTPDMQTHKNPGLRQGPAPFKAPTPARPNKPLPTPGAGALPEKPPVFMRDGKKWLIEYQKGNSNLVVENADMNNVVYMFRCRDSALTVRGKVNGVVLDSCTKCAVVFDNLVSSVEFVNCQSVQMQVLGKVPTISIDKTDGCQIYLSPESLDVEIVSSKSSEMNVLLPKANGDYTELPIPEQFKTLVNKPPTGLTTTPVENKG